ncbi:MULTISPECIES: chorismate mutase [unclassified Nonomuraea]|uniref:chorismate mutase n=1 Tax=unclassified Nonomuraea TaxID=2593643 RepID=UPI0033CB1B9E
MDELTRLRERIDVLDEEIATRLAQRFEVVRRVGELKRAESIPMMQTDRVTHVHEHYRRRGAEQGTPPDFTQSFVDLLLQATCGLEDTIIDAPGEIR